MPVRRIILIVLDSVGIGALPDADHYHDAGSNTLGNIARSIGGLFLPHLRELGLGNIHPLTGITPVQSPLACYGKMNERSSGKDTTTGHWELAGLVLDHPFPVYPNGFPNDLIQTFEQRIGTHVLGNKAASGTEIIAELGDQHLRTGYPIVYTSADSVWQIACHEDIYPPVKLYEFCTIARRILTGEHAVGRVIARPFVGTNGHFIRTPRRKDFSLEPTGETVLDRLKHASYPVYGIGKIEDIFAFKGLTQSYHSRNNQEGMTATLAALDEIPNGLIFVNLVDFDMLYGHRNDVSGYARALQDFDQFLPILMGKMNPEDMLVITADHGCDPTMPGTDHTREYVPLLVYGSLLRHGVDLGIRKTYSDVASTISEVFSLAGFQHGTSFLDHVSH